MSKRTKVIAGVVFLIIVIGTVTYRLRCNNPNCTMPNQAMFLGDCYSCS